MIGRDRQRQRHQPDQSGRPGKSERDQPGGADADHERPPPTPPSSSAVSNSAARQHIGDRWRQMAPVHRQATIGMTGGGDHESGRGPRRVAIRPAGAGNGAGSRWREVGSDHEILPRFRSADRATWREVRSRTMRSIIEADLVDQVEAALRLAAILESGSVSALSVP